MKYRLQVGIIIMQQLDLIIFMARGSEETEGIKPSKVECDFYKYSLYHAEIHVKLASEYQQLRF